MKSIEFLTALGHVSDEILLRAEKPARKPLRRATAIAGAVAACLCLTLFGAVWLFGIPTTTNALISCVCRIDDRLAVYNEVSGLSRYEQMRLPDTPGEVVAIHGTTVFYRAKGEDDLHYLLRSDGEDYTLLEFASFINIEGIDMTTSLYYEYGLLTDDDLAALSDTAPTFGDVLRLIYGVEGAEDIESVRFSKDDFDNARVGRSVKVKAVTVRSAADVAELYDLLATMTARSETDVHSFNPTRVFSSDQAYREGQAPLSIQTDRTVTVRLTSGRTLTLSYSPVDRTLYRGGETVYTPLSESANAWLIELAGIDMAYRDYGTEPAAERQGREEIETATPSPVPETESE